MKKINSLLITLTTISTIYAQNETEPHQDLVRAGFWIFTLVLSLGGMMFILKKRYK